MLIPGSLFSQESRTKCSSLEVSSSLNYVEGNKIHVLFHHAPGRIEWMAGLEFPLITPARSALLYGADLGMNFFPAKDRNPFDMYFTLRTEALRRKLSAVLPEKGLALNMALGYGFNVTLTENLLFTLSAGTGAGKSFFRNHRGYTDLVVFIQGGVVIIFIQRVKNTE
jgi:hypothetical protein